MRDFKFRAWYKYQKEMKEVLSLDFINKKVYIQADKSKKPFGYIHFDDCELMQYTGVHDAGELNTELYEGDKVKFMYREIEYIGEVVFEAGAFIIGCKELSDSYITLLAISNCDDGYWWIDGGIIGNIYEK